MAGKVRNFFFEDLETPPNWKELVLDLAAFIWILVIALLQDWKAADVVWAAWLGSLIIGLSFYFVMTIKLSRDKARGVHLKEEEGSGPGCLGLGVMGFMGLLAWLAGPGVLQIILFVLIGLAFIGIIVNGLAPKRRLGLNPEHPVVRVILFLPTALFLFFFFLGHFGIFHLGHAFVLSFLVPVTLEISGDAGTFEGIRNSFFSFFQLLFAAYWPYVLSVGLAKFPDYIKALKNPSSSNYMILPYKNVVRIHILIFILAPIAMAGLGKVVTIVVLFFFYFPVERVVAWIRSRN
ncbi:MAG: hypothetical protein JW969_09690 [Spirochaetales bacterium]|nr:hypothetical protein [Spirochaetales bacterium]